MTRVNYRSILQLLVALSLALTLTQPTIAASVGLDFTGGTLFGCGATSTAGCTSGWGFHVNSAVVVSGLGFWDRGADGIADSHDVGIWTLGTTLLTSATITNAATAVGSSEPSSRWLFVPVDPVTLPPGDYVLGAFYASGSPDLLHGNATASTAPQITFTDARIGFGASLAFPPALDSGNNAGFFGPNLQLADVPEPTALTLLSSGLIALRLWKRRRRESQ